MSASHKHKRQAEAEAPAEAQVEASQEQDEAEAQTEAQDQAQVDLSPIEITVADLTVPLPRRHLPGQPMTTSQAMIVDTFYARQFYNNQNANAKARAAKYTAAVAAGDTSAMEKNRPLTVNEILDIYKGYHPSISDTPRASAVERMRKEAAWKAWVVEVSAHNKSVTAGGAPVIVAAGSTIVQLMPAAERPAFIERMLGHAGWAERIQIQMDALMAEQEAKKGKSTAGVVKTKLSAVDLL